jgi:PKD repeat protein
MNYTWSINNVVVGSGNTYTSTTTPGTYTICLLISDTTASCSDSICQTITIGNAQPCQANFYIFPDSNGAPHTYIGVNTSNGGGAAMNYVWSWGDGTTSTGAYPSHTYASAGSYTICLYISTPAPNSCSDSLCLTSTINKTESMYTINFYAPNAVNDVKSELATIYPNPTKSSFMIKGNKGNTYAVDFYTVNGIKVKTSSVNANENMNISTLANGIYILKVIDQNGATQYSKLIKE